MKMTKLVMCAMATAAIGLSAQAYAEQDGQGGKRRGPPPEAIEACSGKQSGDSVSFATPRGDTINATCQEKRGQLVALPEGHRKGGRGEGRGGFGQTEE